MSTVRRLSPAIFALLLTLGAGACTVDRPQARPSATPSASPGPPAAPCAELTRLNAALEAYQRDTLEAWEPALPGEVEDAVDATLNSEASAAGRAALELRPKLSATGAVRLIP
ncbi:hypothetical protein [Kribbella sp. DT2]|uniref:hypothetical protein n=1 Tax=Kribbella sp. DT2 TaxID=3393427 RepID=UPI003CF2FE7D